MNTREFKELYQSIIFQREVEYQELKEFFRHQLTINCATSLTQLRFVNQITEMSLEEVRQEKFIDDSYKEKANKFKASGVAPEMIELYLSSARNEIISALLSNRVEIHARGVHFIEHELFSIPSTTSYAFNFTAMHWRSAASDSDSDDDCEEIGAFVIGGLGLTGTMESSY